MVAPDVLIAARVHVLAVRHERQERRIAVLLLGEAPRDRERERPPDSMLSPTCQPVSPVGPWPAAPAPPLVTFPVTQKALSLPGKGLDLRKLVAGAGFEPATSGL